MEFIRPQELEGSRRRSRSQLSLEEFLHPRHDDKPLAGLKRRVAGEQGYLVLSRLSREWRRGKAGRPGGVALLTGLRTAWPSVTQTGPGDPGSLIPVPLGTCRDGV